MQQNRVKVVDKNGQELMPCHPARARKLMAKGRAKQYRYAPYTIQLLDREGGEVQAVQCKLDPGSKTTGITLVGDFQRGKTVIWAAELSHKGEQIKADLQKRAAQRRNRRSRKTRYRKPRFNNRRKPEGWLPPSLMSRVQNVQTWVRRLSSLVPITSLSMELVKFDLRKMMAPEVSGVQYQQGELQGYQVREYLLEKWRRSCAYCDATDVPLEIEHVLAKSRGGSDRVSNLTLACTPCNQRKGSRLLEEFLAHDSKRLAHILSQAKKPLKDAAVMNSTRWKLFKVLKAFGFPLETSSGARTKFNRSVQSYPKQLWIDAACVGASGEQVKLEPTMKPLIIKAMGRGSRQMCRVDKYGFPHTKAKSSTKKVKGFQTGDIVRAVVTQGKKAGIYVGRVAVRSSGSFNIKTAAETIQGISYRYCTLLHKQDGYAYA